MMKGHLEDLLDNALEMYDKEVLKNIQLKKQYEIMKMNAEYLIEKNDELNKKNNEQDEEIERLHFIIKEIREYIEAEKVIKEGNTLEQITRYEKNLLEILNKENK